VWVFAVAEMVKVVLYITRFVIELV
jgi:hypothetical protein